MRYRETKTLDTPPRALLSLALRGRLDGQLYLLRDGPVVHAKLPLTLTLTPTLTLILTLTLTLTLTRYMSAIALCYGRAATDLMLEGWVTSTCISWCGTAPSNP